jgi:ribonuclease HII
VAGIDEAGRGPLAGPVVAAAVILPHEFDLPGLNDSKKLTPARREVLAGRIKEQAEAWAVARVEAEVIDDINILQASLQAMRLAVCGLIIRPDALLIDGRDVIDWSSEAKPFYQIALVKGDALSASVAAASILAKVERDQIMTAWHEIYPDYGFAQHKGYGTQKHLDALRRLGSCPLHRVSYAPVRELCSRTGARG